MALSVLELKKIVGMASAQARSLLRRHDADPDAHALTRAPLGVIAEATGTSLPIAAGPSGFQTLALGTVVSSGNGSWSNGVWTPDEAGTYMCIGGFRADALPARNFGLGVHTANADGAHFVWSQLGGVAGASRQTLQYVRLMEAGPGDGLRFFYYNDTTTASFTSGLVGLTITRIA